MSSRITSYTQRLPEPELCRLLYDFLELKLQIQFLKNQSSTTDEDDTHPTPMPRCARPNRAAASSPSRRRTSATSRFGFRCTPVLYHHHALPLVVDDAHWHVELYREYSKLPCGYDALQFSLPFYRRNAYALIVSSSPSHLLDDTLAMVQTVLAQCEVHLHVRTQPIGCATIADVMRQPRLVLELCNDPRNRFDNGYTPDSDDGSSVGETTGPITVHPRYRVGYIDANDRGGGGGEGRRGTCVLLVCEMTTTVEAVVDDRRRITVVYPRESSTDARVDDSTPEESRHVVDRVVGDETSAYYAACSMYQSDGDTSHPDPTRRAPTLRTPDDHRVDVSGCHIEAFHPLGFECLRRFVMGVYRRRTIRISRHAMGRCQGVSCTNAKCYVAPSAKKRGGGAGSCVYQVALYTSTDDA